MAALASRLWDMEVKGGTMKLLYTLQSRRSLLMGKAVFGLLETALMTAIEMGAAALLAAAYYRRMRNLEVPPGMSANLEA